LEVPGAPVIRVVLPRNKPPPSMESRPLNP
jgi:hypothetical protein